MMLLTGLVMHAQNTIEVAMTDFDNDSGHVRIGLYKSEGSFLNTTYKATETKILNGKAIARFEDIPDGIYAISCYHDKDDNGSLNMIMGMIPSEPYGTSNNARGFFGPPKWEDAKFEVKDRSVKKLNIRL
jgi:uncharacterized protein (DUF2141 family)